MIYMKKNNYYNCIYMYINKLNGRKYIGQAQDFNKRHRHHIAKSTNKYPIDRAFNKYGKENFEIKILAENIPTQEQMNEYEKFIERIKEMTDSLILKIDQICNVDLGKRLTVINTENIYEEISKSKQNGSFTGI